LARAPDERYSKAYELYKSGMKLIEISNQLNLPEGTVRRWKSTHKWDNERSDNNSERSHRKKGGQPGNKNATGPPKNKNAEKYGFFSRYLPGETLEIFNAIENSNPIDLLWHQIQIAYAAIVRAQSIMYVSNKQDKSIEKVADGKGKIISQKWEVQQAWDKQANFLQAQARAQTTLNGLIKQYEEMCKSDLATEEQRARIELIKKRADIGKEPDTSLMQALLDLAGDNK
jgi:uncharacterized protein YjcR